MLNVCRNHLRERKSDFYSLEALSGGLRCDGTWLALARPDPQQLAEERELHRRVLQAVSALSPGDRAATLLFYYQGLSLQEIAAILEVSVVAVKSRLHNARKRLREQLLPVYPEMNRRLALRGLPELRSHPGLPSPVLIGLANPAVVLPRSLMGTASCTELRGFVAHELAHLQRRDLWWNGVMAVAHGLFPFHPLVWLAESEARLAQDVVCDAAALEVAATPVSQYGEALLRVATVCGAKPLRGLAVVGVVESYASLKRRIVMMARVGSNPNRGVARPGPLLIALLLLAVIPWRLTQRVRMQARIVFGSSAGGDMEIFTMLPDGSDVRRLTNDRYTNARPEWSPDRKQIAWQKNFDGNLEIYVMDADGSHPRNLTRNPANDEMPSWSPDGKRIVFTRALGMSGKWPNRKLFVMDADGSNAQQLSFGQDPDWAPAWSPDGKQIAFSSTRVTGWNRIWTVNADGSDVHPVSRDGWNDMTPSWSPDGRRLLFDRRERYAERDTLMSVNRDGSGERVLKRDLSGILYPDYSPDGKKAVFSRGGEIVALELATGALSRLAGRSSHPTERLEDMLDPVTGEARPWAREMLGDAQFPRWRR